MMKIRERSRIQKSGEHESVRNAAFVAGAVDFVGRIAIETVRVLRAVVNVSAFRGNIAQGPMEPGSADFVKAQVSECRDLPGVAEVTFKLRFQPRKRRTDLVGRLECFSRD